MVVSTSLPVPLSHLPSLRARWRLREYLVAGSNSHNSRFVLVNSSRPSLTISSDGSVFKMYRMPASCDLCFLHSMSILGQVNMRLDVETEVMEAIGAPSGKAALVVMFCSLTTSPPLSSLTR